MKNSGTWRKVQIQLEVNEPKVQPSGSKKKGRLIKFMRNKTLKLFTKFVDIDRDRISKQFQKVLTDDIYIASSCGACVG